MRCPDCNKFVSFDTETDPEEESIDVTPQGEVSAVVRIVNMCQECGNYLKEATLEMEGVAEIDHDAKCKESELEVSVDNWSRTDRRQTTDRHGKPIKSHRYQRQYYGAEGTAHVVCACGASADVPLSGEVMASGMEEMV